MLRIGVSQMALKGSRVPDQGVVPAPAQYKARRSSNRNMAKYFVLMLVIGICGAKAETLEIKYNLVGALIPQYAEHGFEIEYNRSRAAVPFARFALIDRDYDHESWEGEKLGRSREEGYQFWVGNKARLIPWQWLRNLEMLVFYRHAETRFAHAGQGRASVEGKERIGVNAIGAGLSLDLSIGKWILIEPFWYGDYGQYHVKAVSGTTAPYSPYAHEWDDEHRVGLNLGIRI